jgi:hypothetical protein
MADFMATGKKVSTGVGDDPPAGGPESEAAEVKTGEDAQDDGEDPTVGVAQEQGCGIPEGAQNSHRG